MTALFIITGVVIGTAIVAGTFYIGYMTGRVHKEK